MSAIRRLSVAQQWSRAEYTWGIGLRGQRTGQSAGRKKDRTEDWTKDRAEDRTWDRTEDRTGLEQYLLGLPLHGSHEGAVRVPAVVQGRVNLVSRVDRTEDRTEDRTADRTEDRTEDRTVDRTEYRTSLKGHP